MTESLAAALAQVQAKLPIIEKTHTAKVSTEKGSYSYDYADLTDVSEAVLPLLAEAGLSWLCRPTLREGGEFVLAYKLLHTSGEREEGAYPLPKSGTPQAIGAAISYARRYALCAVTGVAPKGDDNDAADQPKTRTAQRQARATTRQPEPQSVPARTAQRARVDGPSLPGDDDTDKASRPQLAKLHATFNEAGVHEREERLDIVRRILGNPGAQSSTDLTKQEASRVIDTLDKASQRDDGFSGFLAELLAETEEP